MRETILYQYLSISWGTICEGPGQSLPKSLCCCPHVLHTGPTLGVEPHQPQMLPTTQTNPNWTALDEPALGGTSLPRVRLGQVSKAIQHPQAQDRSAALWQGSVVSMPGSGISNWSVHSSLVQPVPSLCQWRGPSLLPHPGLRYPRPK